MKPKFKLSLAFLAASFGLTINADALTYTYSGSQTAMNQAQAPVATYDTVDWNISGGYFGTSGARSQTYANPNLIFTNVSMNNGWGEAVTRFSSATTVIGAGPFSLVTAGLSQDFVFAGNMQGYSGNVSIASSTGNAGTSLALGNSGSSVVQYGGETAGGNTALGTVTTDGSGNWINNVAGTGTITARNLVFNYGTDSSYDYVRITNAISQNISVNFTGNANVVVGGVISGGGALNKSGAGTLTLTNTNSYTGLTTVTSGTLALGHATNTIADTAAVTINGGTLSIGANSDTTGAVTLTSGNITGTGGTLTASSYAVTSGTISAILGGSGTLTKSGAGTVTLSGANTYTGATTVSSGNLNLTGSLTSAVTANGGVISGSGSTTGLLTMNIGSSIGLLGGGTTTSLTSNGVNFAGATSLVFLTAPVTSTVYDVVTYGAGGVTNLANFNPGVRGTVNNDTGAQKITFTAGGAEARTWNTTSGTWDLYTTANFAEGDQKFANGDSVVFGDIATDATVTLSGALAPNGVAVQNSANTYTFTGSAITGSTSLTKNNAGTLTLSSQQTYTGGTTVNGGVLSLGYGGSGGAIRGTVTVNAGGTLSLATGDALGYNNDATAVNAIYLNGGTLTSAAGSNQTTTAKFHLTAGTINGPVNLDLFSNNAAITTYASPDPSTISVATMNLRQNDTVFDVADGTAADDLLISSAIGNGSQGNHAMIKSGAGTMKLTGVSSFTGNVTVNGGTLDLTSGKLYNGDYNNTNVVTVNTGGTLRMGSFAYDAASGLGKLADYSARRVINGGTIEVTGGSHSSGNDFTVEAGGGTFRYSASSNTLTLAGNANDNIQLNGALTFDTIGDITVNEVMQGTGGLTKTGAGTLTLGADNTYAGNTNVTQGTLVINGSVSTGNLTVQSGATLMGSGTVGGATSIAAGAYLSPGNSPEVMTFGSTLGLNGTTLMEIGGLIRGTDYDGVDVAGLLSYGGALSIVSWNSFSLATAASYQLFGISGGSTGSFDSVSVGGLSLVNDGGGIWSAADPGDSEIVYTFTQSSGQLVVIPEPGAALLGGLGLVLLLRRRR